MSVSEIEGPSAAAHAGPMLGEGPVKVEATATTEDGSRPLAASGAEDGTEPLAASGAEDGSEPLAASGAEDGSEPLVTLGWLVTRAEVSMCM